LMTRAGFDPRESIGLWQNMSRAGGPKPPEFLSTHPSGETRINSLQQHMPKALAIYEQARAQGRDPHCTHKG
jgi:predicted Zn-dependent protease